MRAPAPAERFETVPPPADAPPPPREDVARHEGRLLQALIEGDPAAALMLASTLAYLDPTHLVARRIKSRCVQRLGKKASAPFPRVDAVPRMKVSWDEIKDRILSREATYVLACVNGAWTIEALVDLSALNPLAAYEALDSLICAGIVGIEPAEGHG